MATVREIPPSGLFLTEWRTRDASPRKTVQEVGKVCKVHKGTVSKWENGKVRIVPVMQRRFAEAVNCQPEDLFRHPDDPSPEDRARERIASEILQGRS